MVGLFWTTLVLFLFFILCAGVLIFFLGKFFDMHKGVKSNLHSKLNLAKTMRIIESHAFLPVGDRTYTLVLPKEVDAKANEALFEDMITGYRAEFYRRNPSEKVFFVIRTEDGYPRYRAYRNGKDSLYLKFTFPAFFVLYVHVLKVRSLHKAQVERDNEIEL